MQNYKWIINFNSIIEIIKIYLNRFETMCIFYTTCIVDFQLKFLMALSSCIVIILYRDDDYCLCIYVYVDMLSCCIVISLSFEGIFSLTLAFIYFVKMLHFSSSLYSQKCNFILTTTKVSQTT